jgi:FlaA1/EpsC-like NDP-sugar epimerase
VYVLEFFLWTTLAAAIRFGPRTVLRWLDGLRRRPGGTRTIIIGDGSTAELLARDLERRTDEFRVAGFVSPDPAAVGGRLLGKPILGTVADLPRLIRRHAITTVLLADRCRDPTGVRRIVETCADSAVRFKIVAAPFEQSERLSAAILEDLSPADLLARDSVAFDEAAIQALVRGRCALVTGAAGSIGSELCRQLAAFGASKLVMVDMNENELYFGARRLAEVHPNLEIRTEVADVRDAERLRRLGDRYRPQDVFHAAAHKHVPLMEDAPEEAVKNNVFGTLNAARMAHLCGAARFVLISTDKAVKPTSVMGATKRVAELVVRDFCRASQTRMTAVRFGNVLGSAGSVVPLFKEQIARGGPVTVTHPECTRYFMTIKEAVGLTLLAGLGGYGDLCVLDMGQPIRIHDLAKYMIMMSGRAGEIPIVFTGLRPGEKLAEQVLTEEEEESQVVRDRIRVTRGPPPPDDLVLALAELRRLAEAGERGGIIARLGELVPTYRVPQNVAALDAPLPARKVNGQAAPAVASVPAPLRAAPRGPPPPPLLD